MLLFTKPNIEVSSWLFQSKTHINPIVYQSNSRVKLPNYIVLVYPSCLPKLDFVSSNIKVVFDHAPSRSDFSLKEWLVSILGWLIIESTTIVKLCLHFVSVCLKDQKWTQTDTKSSLVKGDKFCFQNLDFYFWHGESTSKASQLSFPASQKSKDLNKVLLL